MLRYDPFERALYILIANIFVGIILASWAIKASMSSASEDRADLGFRSRGHTLLAVLVTFILGLGLFLILNPTSREPIFILNIFSLVLPVSIAEVMVCWALVGKGFERLFKEKSKPASILAGILMADIFFAFYHFAHRPPFNQLSVELFLLIPGLVTGLVYFIGRELYAAIVIQNFLGMIGVSRNADAQFYGQPLYPLYYLALLAVLALLLSDMFIIGKERC
jgi:hypothetical protein